MQLQVAEDRPLADEMVGRMRVVLEPGSDEFAGGAAAAHRVVAFDNRDLQAGFCKIGGADQPVVPATDDNAIVFHGRASGFVRCIETAERSPLFANGATFSKARQRCRTDHQTRLAAANG